MNETYSVCSILLTTETELTLCYIFSILYVFGIICNVLNIITFTRKNMASPVNTILLVLALLHLIFLLVYVINAFCKIMIIPNKTPSQSNIYGWILFKAIHTMLSSTVRRISTWLTILLTVYRYMAVVHPFKNGIWRSTKKTSIIIVIVCVINLLVLVPVYLEKSTQFKNVSTAENGSTTTGWNYFKDKSYRYGIMVYSFLSFTIPSILQIVLITRLVSSANSA